MFAISKLGPGRFTADVTLEVAGGGQCRATARIVDRGGVVAPALPDWAKRPMRMSGVIPPALLVVPVFPVCDLPSVVAGLRALGFAVTESTAPKMATATWPGVVLELVHAPMTPGSGCHIVIEAVDSLVAAWKSVGVDVRVVEHGGERVALVEVPGGLNLTFGDRLPEGFTAPTKRRPRGPRRRA